MGKPRGIIKDCFSLTHIIISGVCIKDYGGGNMVLKSYLKIIFQLQKLHVLLTYIIIGFCNEIVLGKSFNFQQYKIINF